jgi:hypothetical protein
MDVPGFFRTMIIWGYPAWNCCYQFYDNFYAYIYICMQFNIHVCLPNSEHHWNIQLSIFYPVCSMNWDTNFQPVGLAKRRKCFDPVWSIPIDPLPLQYIHSIYTYRMISDSHETAFLSRLGYDSKALFFLRDELRQQLCWCENKGRAPRCSYSIYCKSIEFHPISLLWVLFGGTIGQFQNPSCFMTIIWGFIHPLYLRNDHNPWVIGNPLLSNNKGKIVQ